MSLELLVGASVSPVSVADVKVHLQIDNNKEDVLIDSYIKTATATIESITGRSLINKTWRQLFLKPSLPLVLLKRPVQEIVAVKYLENRLEVVWEAGNYALLDFKIEADKLPSDYIYVDYKSGYGENPEDVPEDIREVIKLLVVYWYENRNELGQITEGFKGLIDGYQTIAY